MGQDEKPNNGPSGMFTAGICAGIVGIGVVWAVYDTNKQIKKPAQGSENTRIPQTINLDPSYVNGDNLTDYTVRGSRLVFFGVEEEDGTILHKTLDHILQDMRKAESHLDKKGLTAREVEVRAAYAPVGN